MTFEGGSSGGVGREAPPLRAKASPDSPRQKRYRPDHIFLINTTLYISFSDTFVVFPESKKPAKKVSEMKTRKVFLRLVEKPAETEMILMQSV